MSRYDNAYRLASEFLENPVAQKTWRNPIKLFKEMGWEVIPFHRWEDPNIKAEGYSVYKNNNFYILYDCDNFPNRTNYTFHHEGGHTVAAHAVIYKNTLFKNCKKSEYKKLEIEATIIGRNIFFPANIVIYLWRETQCDVEIIKQYYVDTYNLSYDYVNVRFKYLFEDYNNMVYPQAMIEEQAVELSNFYEWFWNVYFN